MVYHRFFPYYEAIPLSDDHSIVLILFRSTPKVPGPDPIVHVLGTEMSPSCRLDRAAFLDSHSVVRVIISAHRLRYSFSRVQLFSLFRKG